MPYYKALPLPIGVAMKLKTLCLTAVTCGLLLTGSTLASAMDCPGGRWQVMPGYHPSMGGACQAMGLDSNAGTCLPGQAYETLCDDRAGGQYITCQGSRPCYGNRHHDRDRDYGGDRYYGGGYAPAPPPPPPRQRHLPPCTNWDYDANRPCPPGMVNLDCRSGCDSPR